MKSGLHLRQRQRERESKWQLTDLRIRHICGPYHSGLNWITIPFSFKAFDCAIMARSLLAATENNTIPEKREGARVGGGERKAQRRNMMEKRER